MSMSVTPTEDPSRVTTANGNVPTQTDDSDSKTIAQILESRMEYMHSKFPQSSLDTYPVSHAVLKAYCEDIKATITKDAKESATGLGDPSLSTMAQEVVK